MDNDQTAKVDNRGAEYNQVGQVQNIAINTNSQSIVHDGGKIYYPSKKDTSAQEQLSKIVFDLLGESKTKLSRLGSFLLGGALLASGAFRAPEIVYSVVPTQPPLYVGVVLIIVGAVLTVALNARESARCKSCGTLYSMKETGKPVGREVTLADRVERRITRQFTCEKCGHQEERVEDDPVAG